MACTVFANMMGLFHKGSSGKGIAFPDVCLTPPPPPAGPIPVPYPNIAQASDLAQGSQTVKVQGNPTALKDSSNVSTSSGDEAGTQGGNVITHKTKGKAYFQLWSFDVKIEGKNAARHGDMMGQNCASAPPGAVNPASIVAMAAVTAAENPKKADKCKRKYKGKRDRHGSPTAAQRKSVQGKPCWNCKKVTRPMIADHQPPCVVKYYAGGCKSKKEMKDWAKKKSSVQPHCKRCSPKQGGALSGYSRTLRAAHR